MARLLLLLVGSLVWAAAAAKPSADWSVEGSGAHRTAVLRGAVLRRALARSPSLEFSVAPQFIFDVSETHSMALVCGAASSAPLSVEAAPAAPDLELPSFAPDAARESVIRLTFTPIASCADAVSISLPFHLRYATPSLPSEPLLVSWEWCPSRLRVGPSPLAARCAMVWAPRAPISDVAVTFRITLAAVTVGAAAVLAALVW